MSGESWYAIYDVADGELVSTGTEVGDPLPAGLAAVAIAGQPQADEVWDASTLAFVAAPAAVTRDRVAEFRADPTVQKVMAGLDQNTIAELADAMTRIFGDVRSL